MVIKRTCLNVARLYRQGRGSVFVLESLLDIPTTVQNTVNDYGIFCDVKSDADAIFKTCHAQSWAYVVVPHAALREKREFFAASQLRQIAGRSGARDISNVEIDVILTYLLQLFHERKITEHVAFKGGTMLRKMIFGPRGRLSTDLDFTCYTAISADDLMLLLLDALQKPYHGISFRFDRDKDWYMTEDGIAANPVCYHADNKKGVKIKLQVSMREKPVLPVAPLLQLDQDYFALLPFKPSVIPSLAFEEVVAEKIRAACQRSKIRDIHDLSEIAARPLKHEVIRALAVLKLWDTTGPNLNYDQFKARIMGGANYDVADLTSLLRKDQRPDMDVMIRRVVDGFRFLGEMTDLERTLSQDDARRCQAEKKKLQRFLISEGTP